MTDMTDPLKNMVTAQLWRYRENGHFPACRELVDTMQWLVDEYGIRGMTPDFDDGPIDLLIEELRTFGATVDEVRSIGHHITTMLDDGAIAPVTHILVSGNNVAENVLTASAFRMTRSRVRKAVKETTDELPYAFEATGKHTERPHSYELLRWTQWLMTKHYPHDAARVIVRQKHGIHEIEGYISPLDLTQTLHEYGLPPME